MSNKVAEMLGIGAIVGVGFITLVTAIFFFLAWILQLLWNGVAVDIFQVPALGYWEACGVYLLSGLLFKSPKINSK